MSTKNQKYRLVDLFAGTGAFSLAFQQTGLVETVFSNDMESSSKTIYDLNFTHPLSQGDVNEVVTESIPEHDILTAGFPCQPFSIAGEQKGFRILVLMSFGKYWKLFIITNHDL